VRISARRSGAGVSVGGATFGDGGYGIAAAGDNAQTRSPLRCRREAAGDLGALCSLDEAATLDVAPGTAAELHAEMNALLAPLRAGTPSCACASTCAGRVKAPNRT
jgi:hypothetical protein